MLNEAAASFKIDVYGLLLGLFSTEKNKAMTLQVCKNICRKYFTSLLTFSWWLLV